jgi:hypothetical protein
MTWSSPFSRLKSAKLSTSCMLGEHIQAALSQDSGFGILKYGFAILWS